MFFSCFFVGFWWLSGCLPWVRLVKFDGFRWHQELALRMLILRHAWPPQGRQLYAAAPGPVQPLRWPCGGRRVVSAPLVMQKPDDLVNCQAVHSYRANFAVSKEAMLAGGLE